MLKLSGTQNSCSTRAKTDKLQTTRLRGWITRDMFYQLKQTLYFSSLSCLLLDAPTKESGETFNVTTERLSRSSDEAVMTSAPCMTLICTHSETVFLRHASGIETLFPFLFVLSLHHQRMLDSGKTCKQYQLIKSSQKKKIIILTNLRFQVILEKPARVRQILKVSKWI